MAEVVFEVEQAGCESCAKRVREALAPLTEVLAVSIDEAADRAIVRVEGSVGEDEVNEALSLASHGSGHAYRIRPGSWKLGS